MYSLLDVDHYVLDSMDMALKGKSYVTSGIAYCIQDNYRSTQWKPTQIARLEGLHWTEQLASLLCLVEEAFAQAQFWAGDALTKTVHSEIILILF